MEEEGNLSVVSAQLQSGSAVFELLQRKDQSDELSWRFVDKSTDTCVVQGSGLGCVLLSDGSRLRIRSKGDHSVDVKKTKVDVPRVATALDAVVVTGRWEEIGVVEVTFAVQDNFLFTQVKAKETEVDLSIKEIRIWEGEVVLGDGKMGYDNLDSGAIVDGVVSPRGAIAIAAFVLVLYTTLYMYEFYTDPIHLIAHFAAACLCLIPMVRGLSAGVITGPRTMFVNSWQSWGFSGSVKMGTKQPLPALHHYFTRGMHAGANHDLLPPKTPSGKERRFFSDMFTAVCDVKQKRAVIAGFLSQRKHFGGIDMDRIMRTGVARCVADDQQAPMDSQLGTDWFVFQLLPQIPEEPLADYCHLVKKANETEVHANGGSNTPLGWCSWYHYYQDITAEVIYENLDVLASHRENIPVNVFQIDDGYQKQWGDWTPKESFPEDMKEVSTRIEEKGFVPGIWMAPFSADLNAEVVKEHSDWVLRDERGRIANSGNCGKFFCGLDVTHPEVLEYAREQLVTATKKWGFRYLKLDFIYSGILHGSIRYDKTKTKAEALDNAVRMIRDAVGKDVFIVGCGFPLGTGIGFVNAMRIGPDVDKRWFPFLFWDKYNLPGAKNAVRNTLTRASMHRRWWVNDPDCVLFRTTTRFLDEELVGIATAIAMGGGMLMLSDEIAKIPESRFKMARSLIPPLERAATALDIFENEEPCQLVLRETGAVGDWLLLALCNWTSSQVTKSLRLSRVFPGAAIFAIRVDANRSGSAAYIGSDFHFSCGAEVASFSSSASEVSIDLDVKRATSPSSVWVQVPFEGNPQAHGDAVDTHRLIEEVAPRIWKFPVELGVNGGKMVITRAHD